MRLPALALLATLNTAQAETPDLSFGLPAVEVPDATQERRQAALRVLFGTLSHVETMDGVSFVQDPLAQTSQPVKSTDLQGQTWIDGEQAMAQFTHNGETRWAVLTADAATLKTVRSFVDEVNQAQATGKTGCKVTMGHLIIGNGATVRRSAQFSSSCSLPASK